MRAREREQRQRVFAVANPTIPIPDSLVAVTGLAARRGEGVDLIGTIAGQWPVERRVARLAYAFDRHGVDVPIGFGADRYCTRESEAVYTPLERSVRVVSGDLVAEGALGGCEPGSVDGLICGPLADAAALISRGDLWAAFRRVVISGGLTELWEPRKCANHRAAEEAAKNFYKALMARGTTAFTVGNDLALWAPIPMGVWHKAADSTDMWVRAIGDAVLTESELQWAAICAGRVPGATPEHFLDQRCGRARPPWYERWVKGGRKGRLVIPGDESIVNYMVSRPSPDVLAAAQVVSERTLGHPVAHPDHRELCRLVPDPSTAVRVAAIEAQVRLVEAALYPKTTTTTGTESGRGWIANTAAAVAGMVRGA